MSSVGLCSKGLILVLWSELVLEGCQCICKLVTSLLASSRRGSKISIALGRDLKKTAFERSDSFFTRVLFFPDNCAITNLIRKDYSVDRQHASIEAVTSSNFLGKNISHSARQKGNDVPYIISRDNANSDLGVGSTSNCYNTSSDLTPVRGWEAGSTDNSLDVKRHQCPPVKRSAALEEMVHCLDGAVTSIDVCILLLTCDRLTAALLRAKGRGVRVRALLDRSMAGVDGSSMLQLRKCNIVVRLLPPTTNSISAASLQKEREVRQQNSSNSTGCSNSVGVAGVSATGLMHHKFAIIDAWKKRVQTNANAKKLQDESRGLFGNGGHPDRSCGGERIRGEWLHGVRPLVITGSFNWTWSAVTSNNENVIISNRPELVLPFSEQFEVLWQQAM